MAVNTSIKEIDFLGLEPRLQLQVKKASLAIDSGQPWYAVDICRHVIRRQPGCLAVRKILRKAQKENCLSGTYRLAVIIKFVFSWADFLLGKYLLSKYPYLVLNSAEKILCRQPDSIRANQLLASTAQSLGFAETALFARQEILLSQPRSVANLLALGNASLALGRLSEAEKMGDRILEIDPMNEAARKLIKRSTVSQTVNVG